MVPNENIAHRQEGELGKEKSAPRDMAYTQQAKRSPGFEGSLCSNGYFVHKRVTEGKWAYFYEGTRKGTRKSVMC